MVPVLTVTYLVWTLVVVAFEHSSSYLQVAAVTAIAVVVLAYVIVLPGSRTFLRMQSWADGREVDRAGALEDTYIWTRMSGLRALWFMPFWAAMLFVVVGNIAGDGSRLIQYAILGGATGISLTLVGFHTAMQGALRPVRVALAGDTGIGGALPRPRPTFAAWLNLSLLGSMFTYALAGAMLGLW